jgi:hypothetical protein
LIRIDIYMSAKKPDGDSNHGNAQAPNADSHGSASDRPGQVAPARRIFNRHIKIQWLTAIIVASSLITGVCYLLKGRVGFAFGIGCEEIACFFGPLFCMLLFILLLTEIIWKRGGHPWSLFIGSLFGFGTFYLWFYEISHH